MHGYTINYQTVKKGTKETKVLDTIVDNKTGEIVEPTCQFFKSPEDYIVAGYLPIEPMSAKEPLKDSHREELFDSDSIAEEKFDGVRGTFHMSSNENRIFSRRISVETEWYGDNSDRLPHFRDYPVPHLNETIIDGELIIPNVDFQEISGMLNMNWDKAIERQVEIGLCEFIAFDIIMYKGVYIAKMPLKKRKKWLEKVVKEMNHPLVKLGEYTQDIIEKPITRTLLDLANTERERFKETYPNLFNKFNSMRSDGYLELNKREWYEYIVLHGGEGLMLKPSDGLYYHKRTREYTKIKKFGTWDVVVTRFLPPTREYDGKEIDTWEYWEGDTPVTKHHYMGWIGTVAYGVVITHEELKSWQKKNPKEKPITYDFFDKLILEVGDCGGFTEEMRSYLTDNQDDLIGTVIEVKGHEVLKTGKIRHPRFIRMREDKGAYQCTYLDHMRN